MTKLESAYHLYPGYQVALSPYPFRVRVWHDDLLLAESDRATFVDETKHVPRIYLPFEDIRLELLRTETRAPHDLPVQGRGRVLVAHCRRPAAGERGCGPTARRSTRSAASQGHVSFYHERVRIEVVDRWPGHDPATA